MDNACFLYKITAFSSKGKFINFATSELSCSVHITLSLPQESAYTQNVSLRAFNVRRNSEFILVLLHLLYDSTKPAAHGIASLICNFQHTGMAVFHGLDSGCHISDTAHSKYFHAHIIADHRLRHGTHTDGICSHACKCANLCCSLITGSHKSHIDALLVGDPHFFSSVLGKVPQFQTVGLGHVREAGAKPFIVGSDEGIRAHHVDKVGDEH